MFFCCLDKVKVLYPFINIIPHILWNEGGVGGQGLWPVPEYHPSCRKYFIMCPKNTPKSCIFFNNIDKITQCYEINCQCTSFSQLCCTAASQEGTAQLTYTILDQTYQTKLKDPSIVLSEFLPKKHSTNKMEVRYCNGSCFLIFFLFMPFYCFYCHSEEEENFHAI